MQIRTTLTIEDDGVAQCLSNLAAQKRLSVFLNIAIGTYLASDEGVRVYKSLAGATNKICATKRKTDKSTSSSNLSTELPTDSRVESPLQEGEETQSSSITPTNVVLKQIFSPKRQPQG